jgi:protoporphyrinogen oxidase
MKNKRIAIVGGGLAGLLIAYRLAKKGHAITVFERENGLGGELSTVSVGHGQSVERYYHHLFLSHKAALNLFTELGLGKNIRWYRSKVAVLQDGQIYPFSGVLDLLRLPFLPLTAKVRMGLASLIIPFFSYHRFEKQTAKEVIIKYMGHIVWERFWEPIFRLKFADYADSISGAWFWGRLKDRASSRRGSELLGYPEGGFQPLVDRLIVALKQRHVDIRTSLPIEQIVKTEAHYSLNGLSFDKVVCALPLPVASKILPISAKERESLTVSKHLAVITVLLETTEDITGYYWTNVLDKEISFGVIVEHTNLVDPKAYGTHLIYLGRYIKESDPLYKKSDAEISDRFISDLEKIYPNAKNKISKVHLFRDRYAQPIITKGYQLPRPLTSAAGAYIFSANHIYPYDRGIERVVANNIDELF